MNSNELQENQKKKQNRSAKELGIELDKQGKKRRKR
jgi:hypothetical protein